MLTAVCIIYIYILLALFLIYKLPHARVSRTAGPSRLQRVNQPRRRIREPFHSSCYIQYIVFISNLLCIFGLLLLSIFMRSFTLSGVCQHPAAHTKRNGLVK